MSEETKLKRKQDAASGVYDRMLDTLLDFHPCAELKVGDVQFIARMARTLAFNAFEDAGL
jgi:hypothetical protein